MASPPKKNKNYFLIIMTIKYYIQCHYLKGQKAQTGQFLVNFFTLKILLHCLLILNRESLHIILKKMYFDFAEM